MRRVQIEKRAFRVPKIQPFSIPNTEESSGIKRDAGPFAPSNILGKVNPTPAVIYVDVEAPMEPPKSSRVTNQARKRPYTSHLPRAAQLMRQMIKLTQTALERKRAEEVTAKNYDAQAVHRTNLRTELIMFNGLSASNPLLGYSVSAEIVKDMPYDWILYCCLHLALRSEALGQIYKNNSPFPHEALIDHCHCDADFFNEHDVCDTQELAWLGVTGAKLEAMEVYCADCQGL